MAVRHGYGKVAGANALVFAYDTGDTRNSYRGEPTVNEIHTHYDVTFESLADGNTATFANQLGTGNYLGVSSTRGYNSSKSLRVNRGTGGTGRVYKTLGLTAGDNITVTAWVYSDVPGPYIHLEYFGGDYSWYVPYTKNSHQGTGWEKLYATANSSATSNTTLYYFFYPSVQNTDTYWDNVQVEKKSHPTIDLSNVSFDSNAQMVFDGSDDYINLGDSSVWDIGGNGTLEMVLRPTNSTGNDRLWCVFNNPSNLDAYLNGTSYDVYMHGGVVGTTTPLTPNQYNHLSVTYTNGTIQIYVNGEPGTMAGTTTGYNITNPGGSGNTNLYLGRFINGTYNLYGDINVFKIYNRGLTAAEVRNNYNNYKGRFDI
jgi:hypothetical protein